MDKLFLWIGGVGLCIILASCQADHNLVEEPTTGYIDVNGYPVGTPYWWRTHPFFEGKEVDEEATLATGDPYLVILVEGKSIYDHFVEALKHQYSEEQIFHLLRHHRDVALSLSSEIPDVDMAHFDVEIPPPTPYEVIDEHCTCPWEEDPYSFTPLPDDASVTTHRPECPRR